MAKRKNPAAVALGRKGGKKGGKARAANLTPEQLSEIGRMGAAKRWAKQNAKEQVEPSR
jgi:general stress protein YciG